MSPKRDLGVLRSDFWHSIDERVERRAGDVIDRALRNHRATGLANLIVGIGSPGSAIVASAVTPWAQIEVPFPCAPEWVTVMGYPAGRAWLDFLVARPTQLLAEATTMVGSTLFPNLGYYTGANAIETKVLRQSDWNQFIEAGSRIVIYVPYAYLVQVLTVNIVVRCV